MPTIREHRESGELLHLDPKLRARDQQLRCAYFSKRSVDWLVANLGIPPRNDLDISGLSPSEQLQILLRRFESGAEFNTPIPHLMRPDKHGIWRVPTAALRLVGWFPERYKFIVSEVDYKVNCTNPRDTQLMQNAIDYRNDLDINGGDYVEGRLDDCI